MNSVYQGSSSSSSTLAIASAYTSAVQASMCKPRSRRQSRSEPHVAFRRQSNSWSRDANVDKMLNSRIPKPFLPARPLAVIHTGCSASIKLLWTLFDFIFCTVQCVCWVMMSIVERSEISRFMPDREDSGRAKGLNPAEFDLGGRARPYRAPHSSGGADTPGRMCRSRPSRARNGSPSNYMLREDPTGGIDESLWVAPGVAYDPHNSQLYNPTLIMPGNIDSPFMYEPFSDTGGWDRSSLPSPSCDQFQRNYSVPGLYSSTAHANPLGEVNPAFASLDPLNQAIISSINHHSPDAFTLNPESSTYHPESYLHCLPSSLMPPVPPTRLDLSPSINSLDSEPVSPGGSRRTRRPNTCDICGKEVRRPGVLEDHMNSHTGQRPYECPRCPRVFTTKSNMQRHIGNFHGDGVGK